MTRRLEARDIVRNFGGVQALRGVSLHVEEGEIVGLIGPNGSGKTTLLNILSGSLSPSSGQVLLDRERVDRFPPYRVVHAGVAKTHQIPKPFSGMTVRENVSVAAMFGGREPDPTRAHQETDRILSLVELRSRADVPAGSLTVQEKKRLEFARALATGARFLLLDETFAGLSPEEVRALVDLFRKAQTERGFGALVVEHVMRAVLSLAARVVVLEEGRVIAEGTPQAIVQNPAVVEAYLGREAVRAPA
ncbi:MAG TPA: ATP-binding cassette domain-containing protein [Thermoplasmata archaeon]|nr:ATP-binding cassette domain-containing protein [Thermoplasmata archaeon]